MGSHTTWNECTHNQSYKFYVVLAWWWSKWPKVVATNGIIKCVRLKTYTFIIVFQFYNAKDFVYKAKVKDTVGALHCSYVLFPVASIAVSIVTHCGLHSPVSKCQQRQGSFSFPYPSRPALGHTQFSSMVGSLARSQGWSTWDICWLLTPPLFCWS